MRTHSPAFVKEPELLHFTTAKWIFALTFKVLWISARASPQRFIFQRDQVLVLAKPLQPFSERRRRRHNWQPEDWFRQPQKLICETHSTEAIFGRPTRSRKRVSVQNKTGIRTDGLRRFLRQLRERWQQAFTDKHLLPSGQGFRILKSEREAASRHFDEFSGWSGKVAKVHESTAKHANKVFVSECASTLIKGRRHLTKFARKYSMYVQKQ